MSEWLKGQTVLVTAVAGIHGFVGGRLVEQLMRLGGVRVRVVLNDYNEAPRIARYPVEMVCLDPTDAAAMSAAVAGCDTVFHCAHDFVRFDRNLPATRVLAQACLEHDVKRLVHLSSVSVYEPLPDGIVDESSPVVPCRVAWADSKKAVEGELVRWHEAANLPVVIIQPTHIYGPWAYNGTIRPVQQMRTGKVVLPLGTPGTCHAIYVDDVVRALLLAAVHPDAAGERFLVSGPAPVTWLDFYRAYESILGVAGIVLRPAEEIRRLQQPEGLVNRMARLGRDPLSALEMRPIRQLKTRLSERYRAALLARMRPWLPDRLYYPDRLSLALYQSQARVSTEKARRMLGFTPKFDLEWGMDLTAQYLRWANLA
jgi:nucleoside-diphosphate-sugar epimerase